MKISECGIVMSAKSAANLRRTLLGRPKRRRPLTYSVRIEMGRLAAARILQAWGKDPDIPFRWPASGWPAGAMKNVSIKPDGRGRAGMAVLVFDFLPYFPILG